RDLAAGIGLGQRLGERTARRCEAARVRVRPVARDKGAVGLRRGRYRVDQQSYGGCGEREDLGVLPLWASPCRPPPAREAARGEEQPRGGGGGRRGRGRAVVAAGEAPRLFRRAHRDRTAVIAIQGDVIVARAEQTTPAQDIEGSAVPGDRILGDKGVREAARMA